MLVIDESSFDKGIESIRVVQNELLDFTTPDDAKRMARMLDRAINDLNRNVTDLNQSIVRGRKQIINER